MGQINKIPLGYLDMLRSQTGGKNPFFASETVNPVVDMTPFYHALEMDGSSVTLAYTGVGDSVDITVPSDEAWFVYTWGFSAQASANTDRVHWLVNVLRLPGGSAVIGPLIASTIQSSSAPDNQTGFMVGSVQFPVPIPLTAGAIIRSTVAGQTGSSTATISVLAAKFKA